MFCKSSNSISDNENTYCNTNGECLYIKQHVPQNNLIENFSNVTDVSDKANTMAIIQPVKKTGINIQDPRIYINQLVNMYGVIDVLTNIFISAKPYYKNIKSILYNMMDDSHTEAIFISSDLIEILNKANTNSFSITELINKSGYIGSRVNNFKSRSTSLFNQITKMYIARASSAQNLKNAQELYTLTNNPNVQPVQYAQKLLLLIKFEYDYDQAQIIASGMVAKPAQPDELSGIVAEAVQPVQDAVNYLTSGLSGLRIF